MWSWESQQQNIQWLEWGQSFDQVIYLITENVPEWTALVSGLSCQTNCCVRFLTVYVMIQAAFSVKVEELGIKTMFFGINHWKVNSKSDPLLYVGQASWAFCCPISQINSIILILKIHFFDYIMNVLYETTDTWNLNNFETYSILPVVLLAFEYKNSK